MKSLRHNRKSKLQSMCAKHFHEPKPPTTLRSHMLTGLSLSILSSAYSPRRRHRNRSAQRSPPLLPQLATPCTATTPHQLQRLHHHSIHLQQPLGNSATAPRRTMAQYTSVLPSTFYYNHKQGIQNVPRTHHHTWRLQLVKKISAKAVVTYITYKSTILFK